jgi:hypothetical protein
MVSTSKGLNNRTHNSVDQTGFRRFLFLYFNAPAKVIFVPLNILP